MTRKVCCVKHNAVEVLEKYEWLGRYIPLVPLDGTKLNINGKIYKAGMVRDAKDPQRVYNYEITAAIETVALAPKDPLMVAKGSINNREEEYRQANRKNYAYLYYDSYDQQGRPLPPPNRPGRNSPIEAMSALVQQADYDLKSIIGIYEAAMGEQGPADESGVAVLQRQSRSDVGSINWSDSLKRSIRYGGNLLDDLYPKLITSARVQRIFNPDDSVKHAIVYNSAHSDPEEANRLLDGKILAKIYDVGSGNYDCTLSTGPRYRTARQEAARGMMALVSANPQLFLLMGDVMVQNIDWPGADVIAARLKKSLPPNLLDSNDTDKDSQIAQLQAQLTQIAQQHQLMVAELARATDTIRTSRLQNESKERIALWQSQAGMIEALIKSSGAAGLEAMKAELGTIQHRMELLHESMSVDQEAGAAPPTPELPGKVEPKVQPVTPAAPVPNPLNG